MSMNHERASANAEYRAAFDEGAQAYLDGASPDGTNPYDDWSFSVAMKRGWRDGYDSTKQACDEANAIDRQHAGSILLF